MRARADDRRVATKRRPVDIGTDRARELIRRLGDECRSARTDRGLSLREVGQAVGLSESGVSRLERGLVERASIHDLARMHAVVGLELAAKSYPGGQPIRDVAHVALLSEFRARLHRSLAWTVEVPLPIAGDRRSWDAVIRGRGWLYGVEAETAPRDAQALARRLALKKRDGRVDGIILVLRGAVQTRRWLREAGDLVRSDYPVEGDRALELLGAGVDPGGSAIVVFPRRRG